MDYSQDLIGWLYRHRTNNYEVDFNFQERMLRSEIGSRRMPESWTTPCDAFKWIEESEVIVGGLILPGKLLITAK